MASAQTVIVDTGIWYALFDEADRQSMRAKEEDIEEILDLFTVLVPWPTAYELLRSKFCKKERAIKKFSTYMDAGHVLFIDDKKFCDEALELSIFSSTVKKRPLSMVDCLIRLMIDDVNTRTDYLATFNQKDFDDICRDRNVEIIGGYAKK